MPKSNEALRVLIMAGGTGGHVFPGLAVAKKLTEHGVQVQWLGALKGIENDLVPQHGYPLFTLPTIGLRGKSIFNKLKSLVNVVVSVSKAIVLIKKERPDVVLGMGGFAAGPGGLAAFLLAKPVIIHEQNSVPGTTNRILAKFARTIFQGFPSSLGGRKGVFVGNPVRDELLTLESPVERGLAQQQTMRLLILGGSLGAKPINDLVPQSLALMPEDIRPEVLHQSGRAHSDTVNDLYQSLGISAQVKPFIEDMAAAYEWADLVICRAGALTIAELMAVGVPALLIPLPHAIDDHQTLNAKWLADQSAGWLCPQKDLDKEKLSEKLIALFSNKKLLVETAENAKKIAKNNAAEVVAQACIEVAHA